MDQVCGCTPLSSEEHQGSAVLLTKHPQLTSTTSVGAVPPSPAQIPALQCCQRLVKHGSVPWMLRKADAQSYTLTIWELPNQILHAVLYGVRGGKEGRSQNRLEGLGSMVRARDWPACDKPPGGLRMRAMRLTHGKLAGSLSAAGVKPEPSCSNDSKEEKAALAGKQRKEGKVAGFSRFSAMESCREPLRIGGTTGRGRGKHPSLVFSMGTWQKRIPS